MKKRTWLVLLGALLAIPVTWYLISPLFINRQVDEAFPTAQSEATPTNPVLEENTTPTLDPTVMAEATQAMEDAMAEPTKSMDDPMPENGGEAMAILFQGSFYNVVHEGMGTASIWVCSTRS